MNQVDCGLAVERALERVREARSESAGARPRGRSHHADLPPQGADQAIEYGVVERGYLHDRQRRRGAHDPQDERSSSRAAHADGRSPRRAPRAHERPGRQDCADRPCEDEPATIAEVAAFASTRSANRRVYTRALAAVNTTPHSAVLTKKLRLSANCRASERIR